MEEQEAQEIVQAAQWPHSGLSAQSIAELREDPEYYVGLLKRLPDNMRLIGQLLGRLRRREFLFSDMAERYSRRTAVIRELTQVPTLPCPKCKGEQEIVAEFEFRDMDGSWAGYTKLACGHNGPQECESGFSLGPDHDPYGVHCELDRSLHEKDERGRTIHRGPNPLPAPGQEIILWTGGGYCAGDPLPRTIVGYEAEKA